MFVSQVSLRVHFCKRDTSQHCCDKTMDGKWSYIAHAVSELFKIMVKKVAFVGFRGAIAPSLVLVSVF